MFKNLTNFCVRLVRDYIPDSFVFAVILSFVVYLAAFFNTFTPPMKLIEIWYGGFWSLLTFAMQMTLILVTGTILATSDLIKGFLRKIASMPQNPTSGAALVVFVSLIASFINWGFGLVIGAILAKEVAKAVKGSHYPLLVASAYIGFLIWHAGFSGSVPLAIATEGNLAKVTDGLLTETIGIQETIFAPFNLLIVAVFLVTLPLIIRAMHPKKNEGVIEISKNAFENQESSENRNSSRKGKRTPAEKLENAWWINLILAIGGYAYIISFFMENGFSLNLNLVNFIFLFTAILLHKTPIRLVRAVTDASKNVGGILLQFPFYAGVMALMKFAPAEGASLAAIVSSWFVQISNDFTYPLFVFLSAGVVNFFVPSGGGQWVVQAPIMMPAGAELGVSAAKTAMAIAWGDAWTNMIQPFWALPILAISGLGAKDIMGYCLVILFYSGIIIGGGLLLF